LFISHFPIVALLLPRGSCEAFCSAPHEEHTQDGKRCRYPTGHDVSSQCLTAVTPGRVRPARVSISARHLLQTCHSRSITHRVCCAGVSDDCLQWVGIDCYLISHPHTRRPCRISRRSNLSLLLRSRHAYALSSKHPQSFSAPSATA